MQLSNNDNWKILYKYIRQSPFPEINPTDIDTYNILRFCFFRVLAYIVHYGNRPSGIAYTDLRHFTHLTIYAFLSVYLSIWYTTAIALLRLHIRISGTSHLTIFAFLCVYLSISVLMWKTGRRLPRIVADGGSTAVHVSTKKN